MRHTAALGERLAAQGVRYIDAPISGSSEQTRRAEATVIEAGDRAAFDAWADLWRVMGQRVFHVGPCGSAAKMKPIGNLGDAIGSARVAAVESAVRDHAAQALLVLKAGKHAHGKPFPGYSMKHSRCRNVRTSDALTSLPTALRCSQPHNADNR